jgi:hypothetical protein
MEMSAIYFMKENFGYLYVYFRANIYGDGESQHIHMSVSKDGLFFEELNNNEPILKAELGTKGVRDPHLFKSVIDGKYYLIATDLDANKGDWGQYAFNGSKLMAVWKSDDLIKWTPQKLVKVAADNGCCMWAPKVCYDKENDNYVVAFSSGVIGVNRLKIHYVTTRDFETFSEPKILKDVEENTEGVKNLGTEEVSDLITFIDSTTIEVDDTYYRFTKREQDITILLEKGKSLLGKFENVKNIIAGEYGVEGPGIYKLNNVDKWILLMDGYCGPNAGKGYFPLIAENVEDLASGNFRRLKEDEFRMPNGAKHGSIISISEDEYNELIKKYNS